jgi:hypothetical protein
MRLFVYLDGTHKARNVYEVAEVTLHPNVRSDAGPFVRRRTDTILVVHSFSVIGLHGVVSVLNAWARRDAETGPHEYRRARICS